MSDINLQKRVQNLSVGKELSVYTGVIINAGQDSQGNDVSYSAGDDTGYVLEISNLHGTQAMADTILAILKLRGVQYHPYDAGGALLDPAAEIGDGVTINGTTSWIASSEKRFSRLMATDISAPYDEEINHEYKYTPRTQREFKRESSYTRARLTVTGNEIAAEVIRATEAEGTLSARITVNAEAIEARVTKKGGINTSFGWVLDSTSHTWYANNIVVMKVSQSGLEVAGKVTATSGTIGGCSIENGVLKVSSANITSINADVITAGTLNVDRISAGSITGGKIAENTIVGGEYGNIDYDTVSTYNTVGGINTNLGYAAGYGSATASGTGSYPEYFTCGKLNVKTWLQFANYYWGVTTLNYKGHDGANRSMVVLSGSSA